MTDPIYQRKRVPLTDLVTEHETMQGVLDQGRVSETPHEPLLVSPREDMPGKYEIKDGHHRAADAIRKGRTHVDVDVDPHPDEEPYREPFYDFGQHMPKTQHGLAQKEWDDEAGDYKTSALSFEAVYAGFHERAADGPSGQPGPGLGQPRGGDRGLASAGVARSAGLPRGAAGGPGGLSDLAARGYNTDGWKRWQQGMCGTYAHALIEAHPHLRLGVGGQTPKGDGDASHGWRLTHFFAHDDHHAYDSAGRHPLPYKGVHGDIDYVEHDSHPDHWDLLEEEGTDEHDVKQAKEHARTHGILEGRYGPHAGRTASAQPQASGVTWHPKAAKDLKSLDRPVQKQVLQTIDGITSGHPTTLSQTHPLNGVMKGWYATKVSRGHRIIHQPSDDGGIHIGYVGLHEYEKAIQRLTSLEARFVEAPQQFKERDDWDERTLEKHVGDDVVAKASYRVHSRGARIFTMSTHPDHRRAGHMTSLIDEVRTRHGKVTFDQTRTPSGQGFIQRLTSRVPLGDYPEEGTAGMDRFFVEDIPVSSLRTDQPKVKARVVKHYLDHPDHEPIVVNRHGDEHWVVDGNHRGAAALMRGDETVRAKVWHKQTSASAVHVKRLTSLAAAASAINPEQAHLWPKHPLFRPGDRVLETVPNGKQYGATVSHQDESTDPDHPGHVWIHDDEKSTLRGRERDLTGVHPSRLVPHPDALAEQHQHYHQQRALNDTNTPYVPEAERHIDESDRVTVHHLTDKHDFAPDHTTRPSNNTTMGGSLSPRLFVGNPTSWAEGQHGYRRPYVAEMSVPKGALRNSQGYLGENEIPARHFDKVHVHRVIPYSEHRREEDEPGYRSSVDTRTWSPKQHKDHLKAHREHLHTEHGWGWNEFDENHNHVGLGDDDWSEKREEYVRRDKKGKPMTTPRSSH